MIPEYSLQYSSDRRRTNTHTHTTMAGNKFLLMLRLSSLLILVPCIATLNMSSTHPCRLYDTVIFGNTSEREPLESSIIYSEFCKTFTNITVSQDEFKLAWEFFQLVEEMFIPLGSLGLVLICILLLILHVVRHAVCSEPVEICHDNCKTSCNKQVIKYDV